MQRLISEIEKGGGVLIQNSTLIKLIKRFGDRKVSKQHDSFLHVDRTLLLASDKTLLVVKKGKIYATHYLTACSKWAKLNCRAESNGPCTYRSAVQSILVIIHGCLSTQ